MSQTHVCSIQYAIFPSATNQSLFTLGTINPDMSGHDTTIRLLQIPSTRRRQAIQNANDEFGISELDTLTYETQRIYLRPSSDSTNLLVRRYQTIMNVREYLEVSEVDTVKEIDD
jgi:hypothetical protein